MNYNYENYGQSEIDIIMAGLHSSTMKTQPDGWNSSGKKERNWDRNTFANIKSEAEKQALENPFKEKLKL